ncbi:hypothetical protein MSG28_002400 [Choristoneura fumiferana]|uniref:Uncharacterized protein n=1 Tax=Choristoneura fumiferana TaxID=7141 RepID=A0ACC0JW71_CHOFU|nr:hypothetical protein MSG28_002400 [Choristoneura fumiferana]
MAAFHDMPKNFMICLNWPNHQMAAFHDMPRNFMICLTRQFNVTRQIVKRLYDLMLLSLVHAFQYLPESKVHKRMLTRDSIPSQNNPGSVSRARVLLRLVLLRDYHWKQNHPYDC